LLDQQQFGLCCSYLSQLDFWFPFFLSSLGDNYLSAYVHFVRRRLVQERPPAALWISSYTKGHKRRDNYHQAKKGRKETKNLTVINMSNTDQIAADLAKTTIENDKEPKKKKRRSNKKEKDDSVSSTNIEKKTDNIAFSDPSLPTTAHTINEPTVGSSNINNTDSEKVIDSKDNNDKGNKVNTNNVKTNRKSNTHGRRIKNTGKGSHLDQSHSVWVVKQPTNTSTSTYSTNTDIHAAAVAEDLTTNTTTPTIISSANTPSNVNLSLDISANTPAKTTTNTTISPPKSNNTDRYHSSIQQNSNRDRGTQQKYTYTSNKEKDTNNMNNINININKDNSNSSGKVVAAGGRIRENRNDPAVKFSKFLSYLLRHGAAKEGLAMRSDGFVKVDDVLAHRKVRGMTFAQLQEEVRSNAKQRFALQVIEGVYYIRANQGHSIEVEDLDLKKVESASELPKLLHGTFYRHLDNIRKEGLKKMERNHIHFTTAEFGSSEVISGVRRSVEVLIYVDVEKAIQDGIEFVRSENNVILSTGIDGVLHPKYFKSVVDAKTGAEIAPRVA